MTRRDRLLAAALLLAPAAMSCKKEEQPAPTPAATGPATTQAASPTATPKAPESPKPQTPLTRTPAAPAMSATPPAGEAPPASAPPSLEAAAPTAAPAPKPATRPRPQGKVTLPAMLGPVTLDHEKHAGAMAIACAKCHHPSRPEMPLVADQQRCRDCHTQPATPPVKTSLRAAIHSPTATAGTCIDCHQEAVAKGKRAPVKCPECHRKGRP